MWHKICDIAKAHSIPVEELETFSKQPNINNKFSIVDDEVSSWFVNDFVQAYRISSIQQNG